MSSEAQRHSIVTKIVLSACGIVAIFLLIGSIMLVQDERRWEQLQFKEYQAEIQRAFEEREIEERSLLEKHVRFNMDVLSQVIDDALFDFDFNAVKPALNPYMNYPEIVAIQVVNDAAEKVAAAWKAPEIRSGDDLPETLEIDDLLSFQRDVFLDEDLVGQIQVYYSDEPLRAKIRAIQEAETEKEAEFRTESQAHFLRKLWRQIAGMFFILFALTICLIVVLRRLVLKPLQRISKAAHKLAELDLTVRVDAAGTDEIGRLCADMNTMAGWFRTALGKVQHIGNHLASSSTQLSATAKEQEATMASQMESTQYVLNAVEDISDLAATLAASMQQIAAMIQKSAGIANRSQHGALQMEKAIQNMEDASLSISRKLEKIREKAEKIGTIVTTIDAVSEQTNLLSLNAAIEAEKAGEYGRGFSVVAREIRRLADRTAVSTLDIGKMVQDMQTAVSSGIMEMDKFTSEVRHSAGEIGEIGVQLNTIIEGVQVLAPGFDHINKAMGEQSGHARKIHDAMQHLSDDMSQTKLSLQETYQVIEQLNNAAEDLQTEVSRFNVSE